MSMMMVRLLVVSLAVFTTAVAEKGQPCTTPNGETATCVPAPSCQVIMEAVLTSNASAIEFAKQSQCGYDTVPLVCCGSSGYPTSSNVAKRETSANGEELYVYANFNSKELPGRTMCGLEKETDRRVQNELAELNELPWLVTLEYKSKITGENAGIKCGGTIINNRYILTSAGCISHEEFEPVSVSLGEWQISRDPDCEKVNDNTDCADPVQKVNIKNQIPHPSYSRSSGDHDIGLLRLEKNIAYTEYIQAICLPSFNLPSPPSGTRTTVAGWGATANGTTSDFKLKTTLAVLSNNECKEKLQGVSVGENQSCAGSKEQYNSCRGDWGGTIMAHDSDHISNQINIFQEGVVSSPVGCGGTGTPAVYTRVAPYMNWIVETISAD